MKNPIDSILDGAEVLALSTATLPISLALVVLTNGGSPIEVLTDPLWASSCAFGVTLGSIIWWVRSRKPQPVSCAEKPT